MQSDTNRDFVRKEDFGMFARGERRNREHDA
jgi:hypothetical protein